VGHHGIGYNVKAVRDITFRIEDRVLDICSSREPCQVQGLRRPMLDPPPNNLPAR